MDTQPAISAKDAPGIEDSQDYSASNRDVIAPTRKEIERELTRLINAIRLCECSRRSPNAQYETRAELQADIRNLKKLDDLYGRREALLKRLNDPNRPSAST